MASIVIGIAPKSAQNGGSWQARKEFWLPNVTRPLQRCARGWLV
jgi:hypothetical protein